MHLLLIPLALLLVVMVAGVRVIRNKGLPSSSAKDLKRIEDWKRARAMGPLWHAFRNSGPFVLGYCVFAPAAAFWKETGRLGYPVENAGHYLVLALVMAIVSEFFAWKILQAGAREAAERLHQNDLI